MSKPRIVKQSLISIVFIVWAITAHPTVAADRDAVASTKEAAVPADEIVRTELPTVVIELTGAVGHSMGQTRLDRGRAKESFDAPYLKKLLDFAISEGAERVILHIDSPGGYAFERNRVCELIDEYRDELEFIAYVDEARGAAVAIALSCEQVFINRSCHFGGSLAMDPRKGYDSDPQWLTWEVESLRRIIESSGRDGQIADALVRKELQLWWHEDHGFSIPTRTTRTTSNESGSSTTKGTGVTSGYSIITDRQGNRIAEINSQGAIVWEARTESRSQSSGESAENGGELDETNWQKMVGEYSVLSLNPKELIDTGIAVAEAKNIEDCLTQLGIAEPIDIARQQKRAKSNRYRNVKATVADYQLFDSTLHDLLDLHRELASTDWKGRNKERKKLARAILVMLNAADKIRAKENNQRSPLSICQVEVCQLEEVCDELRQAQEDLKDHVSNDDTNPKSRKHILAAVEAWDACLVDFSSSWSS